jgi:hypothetical protein
MTTSRKDLISYAMAEVVSQQSLTTEAWVHFRSDHVGFVVDKVALGQVFVRVLWCFPVSIIPPLLCIHSLFYRQCYIIKEADGGVTLHTKGLKNMGR